MALLIKNKEIGIVTTQLRVSSFYDSLQACLDDVCETTQSVSASIGFTSTLFMNAD